jgi:hypothetical protein
MDAFSESLYVSLWGMMGIFITMFIIGGVTVALTKLFPGR